MKLNIDKQKLKEGGAAVGLACLAILGSVAKNTLQNFAQTKVNAKLYEKSSYSSVIAAIVNSDMWASDKERAIEAIPKDGTEELYGSIMAIILGGDMWSSNKLRTIESLCEKED